MCVPPMGSVPTDSPIWTRPNFAKRSVLTYGPAWAQPQSAKGECLRWNLHCPAWTQPCSTDSPAWTEPPSFLEGGVSPLIVQHRLSHIPPGEGVPTDSPAWTHRILRRGVSSLIVQHGLNQLPPKGGRECPCC